MTARMKPIEHIKKRFPGEEGAWLPEGRIEPYRLWFEYLKLADRDPDVTVDEEFYRSWGDWRSEDFNAWWEKNWRRLFGAPTARWVTSADILAGSENARFIEIPPNVSITSLTRQIRALLAQSSGGAVTTERKIDAFTERLRLFMYEKKLDGLTHEEAAVQFHDWAAAWNLEVRQRKLKRSLIHIPAAFHWAAAGSVG